MARRVCVSSQSGQHELTTIYTHSRSDQLSNVVRWCQSCGAVVVDVDQDGVTRSHPGRISTMLFPALAHNAAQEAKGK